jgi:hypothetical protein
MRGIEIDSEMDSPTPPDYEGKLLGYLIDDLFSATQYANLTTQDLRKYGSLPDGKSLEGFILEQLNLEESIQEEMFRLILQHLPGQELSEEEINQLFQRYKFFPEEERKICFEAIARKSWKIDELAKSPSMREFTLMVLKATALIEYEELTSIDPQTIYQDLQLFDSMAARTPMILTIDEQTSLFVIHFPPLMNQKTRKQKEVNLKDCLVVADSQKNQLLSEYLTTNIHVLRYFVGCVLDHAMQKRVQEKLKVVFRDAAKQKIAEAQKKIEPYNTSLQLHFFTLLLQEVTPSRSMRMLCISRNEESGHSLSQIGKKYNQWDQASANAHRFVLYREQYKTDVLSFAYEDEGRCWHDVDVRWNEGENTLEYRVRPERPEEETQWQSSKEIDRLPAREIKDIFDSFVLLTPHQLGKNEALTLKDATHVQSELKATKTVAGFLLEYHQCGLGRHPDKEFLVSSAPSEEGLHLVDVFENHPNIKLQ